eukprot:CAMPEP_0181312628 /NCGR_PEP_ID=MMETSP1101-20121128/13801_1 /TAXON_ID=46948 /ORGANISM="Rhodomonas abbreviata, Strain Caron Lab Isolate" /LENGTH=730 /DNA_ID=CAMNT_0023419497 /DNA_START=133 /DNA_END=2324 /DNA_ORIENTATION=-
MTTFEQQPLQVPDFAFPFTPPEDIAFLGSDGDDDSEAAMFAGIDENREFSPPDATFPISAPKKRRRTKDNKMDKGSPASSEDSGGDIKGAKPGSLRLTDAIDKLAAIGEVLKFDSVDQLYVVLDGPGFESRFDELRCTRAKRSDGTNSRPFSRMHNHYVLVRGEKWAKTGSAFRAKDAVHELPRADQVQASKINVTLLPTDEPEGFQVTLQHFLNVTGAGDLFKNARRMQEMGMNGGHMEPEPIYPVQYASNQDYANNVSGQLDTMWNQNSKGDQAYFFFRHSGVSAMRNGSIVMLKDGKLCADDTPSKGCIYMVVSDDNAKWKGEPLPTPEEETLGHWCCFLGQVPVWVAGPVKCGDYIGPQADGSGVGVVKEVGSGWPAEWMAGCGDGDEGKEGEEPGIVRTLCFAGLNAMSEKVGGEVTALMEQALATKRDVSDLKEDLERTKKVTDANTITLAERLSRMEERLMGEQLTSEDLAKLEEERQRLLSTPLYRNLSLIAIVLALLTTTAVVFFLIGWFGLWGSTNTETRVVVVSPPSNTSSPLSPASKCSDVGTEGTCLALQGCEWIDFGDRGSYCLSSSLFEQGALPPSPPPACATLSSPAACDAANTPDAAVMCEWSEEGGEAVAWGVCRMSAVAKQLLCSQRFTLDACLLEVGCEWLTSERGDLCVVQPSVCSSLTTALECDKASVCAWAPLTADGPSVCTDAASPPPKDPAEPDEGEDEEGAGGE